MPRGYPRIQFTKSTIPREGQRSIGLGRFVLRGRIKAISVEFSQRSAHPGIPSDRFPKPARCTFEYRVSARSRRNYSAAGIAARSRLTRDTSAGGDLSDFVTRRALITTVLFSFTIARVDPRLSNVNVSASSPAFLAKSRGECELCAAEKSAHSSPYSSRTREADLSPAI